MAAPEQAGQVVVRVGGFGQRVQGRLHGLCLFQFGDVAGYRHPHLVGFRPARRPHDMDDATVLAHVAVFEMDVGLAVHDRLGGCQGALAVGGRHQVGHPLADHFLLRVTKDAPARCADEQEFTTGVDDTDCVEQQVGETGYFRVDRIAHANIL